MSECEAAGVWREVDAHLLAADLRVSMSRARPPPSPLQRVRGVMMLKHICHIFAVAKL